MNYNQFKQRPLIASTDQFIDKRADFKFSEPHRVNSLVNSKGKKVRYYQYNNSGPHGILKTINYLPSVTSIISNQVTKAGLQEWTKAVGEEYANKIATITANRGQKLHHLCEDYVQGKEINLVQPDMRMFATQIFPMLRKIDEFYGIESPVRSFKHKFAGRTDMFARYKGANAIVDYKTNQTDTSSPAFKEKIDCYFIQMAAYAIAIEEQFDIKVPAGVIMMASTDYPPVEEARVFTHEKEMFIELAEQFHKDWIMQ